MLSHRQAPSRRPHRPAQKQLALHPATCLLTAARRDAAPHTRSARPEDQVHVSSDARLSVRNTHLIGARRRPAFDGALRVRPLQALREVAPPVGAVHGTALVVSAWRHHVRPDNLGLLIGGTAAWGAACASGACSAFGSASLPCRSSTLCGSSHFACLKLQHGAARGANDGRAHGRARLHDDKDV